MAHVKNQRGYLSVYEGDKFLEYIGRADNVSADRLSFIKSKYKDIAGLE